MHITRFLFADCILDTTSAMLFGRSKQKASKTTKLEYTLYDCICCFKDFFFHLQAPLCHSSFSALILCLLYPYSDSAGHACHSSRSTSSEIMVLLNDQRLPSWKPQSYIANNVLVMQAHTARSSSSFDAYVEAVEQRHRYRSAQ